MRVKIQVIMFQFQYGAIKGTEYKYLRVIKFSFNSSMVRLKENTFRVSNLPIFCFNSSMVRLKAAYLRRVQSRIILVSIPVWCD